MTRMRSCCCRCQIMWKCVILLLLGLASTLAAASPDDWLTAANSQEDGGAAVIAPLGDDGVLFKSMYAGWGAFYPLERAAVLVQYQIFDMDHVLLEGRQEPYDGLVGDLPLPVLKMALTRMVEGDEWELYVPATDPTAAPTLIRVKFLQMGDTPDKVCALTCNLRTKENCNERELKYSTNIAKGMRGHPKAMRNEIIRLRRHFGEGKIESPEHHNWQERRIFLLAQLADLEDERIANGVEQRLEF
jgi:hypothetical protein